MTLKKDNVEGTWNPSENNYITECHRSEWKYIIRRMKKDVQWNSEMIK